MVLSHFLRVHLLVSKYFATYCWILPLDSVLFAFSTFSSVSTSFCVVMFYIFPFPYPVLLHKHVVCKENLTQQKRNVEKLSEWSRVCMYSLPPPPCILGSSTYLIRMTTSSEYLIYFMFFYIPQQYVSCKLSSLYYLLALNTQYQQYRLRYLLEILQF